MNLFIFIVAMIGSFILYALIRDRRNNYLKCPHGISYRIGSDVNCSLCQKQKALKAEEDRLSREQQAIEDEIARKKERELRELEAENCHRLSYLQELHPAKFEGLVCELYRRLGYVVSETSYSGDQGVDGYLNKDGKKTILQCKRYSKSRIGSPVLRDLLGTIITEEADGGILVTTSSFSEDAISFAKKSGKIELVDGNSLVDLIGVTVAPGELLPKELSRKWKRIDVIPSRCPRCGSQIKKRNGPYGEFYGCTDFPNCKWTMRKPNKNQIAELFDKIDDEYGDQEDTNDDA